MNKGIKSLRQKSRKYVKFGKNAVKVQNSVKMPYKIC